MCWSPEYLSALHGSIHNEIGPAKRVNKSKFRSKKMKIENVKKIVSLGPFEQRFGVRDEEILQGFFERATPELIMANGIAQLEPKSPETIIHMLESYRDLLLLYWGENKDKIMSVLQDMETDEELTPAGICEAIVTGKIFSLI